MPLKSAILANNTRLENAAGGGPSVKKRPPDDDVDAVKRIQRALVKLGARMPISFPNGTDGEPDGKYGNETYNAVLAFQKQQFPTDASQWDGRTGQHTLAKMDALLPAAPAPPAPPTPPGPRPIVNRNEAIKAIRDYLVREKTTDVVKTLMDRPENMVLLGETHHIFDAGKAFLLVQLVREARRRQMVTSTSFHASERFTNDKATRDKISEFMRATPIQQAALMLQLTGDLMIFAPVLVEASRFPQNRYGILPIDINKGGVDLRQELLFRGFNDAAARCPDVPLGSINSRTSRGNILIGAQHASRVGTFGGAVTTTCGHLVKAGWRVHVVRLTATKEPGLNEQFQGTLNLVLRDPAADHTPIDCLEIADGISGGRPFYADLTKSDSPFAQLHVATAANIPFNKLFDALLHLPALS